MGTQDDDHWVSEHEGLAEVTRARAVVVDNGAAYPGAGPVDAGATESIGIVRAGKSMKHQLEAICACATWRYASNNALQSL